MEILMSTNITYTKIIKGCVRKPFFFLIPAFIVEENFYNHVVVLMEWQKDNQQQTVFDKDIEYIRENGRFAMKGTRFLDGKVSITIDSYIVYLDVVVDSKDGK
jgi:hypothetical protein